MGLITSPDLINGTNATAGQINALKSVVLGTLNGGIDVANLADGAITAPKLADGAITAAKLPDGGITTTKLADGAVTVAKLEPKVNTITTSATVTPDRQVYIVTALATATVIGAPTFTPYAGQSLIIRFKDDGTARGITYNAIYRAIGVTAPSATVAGKELYIGAIYNAAATKWDIISVAREG